MLLMGTCLSWVGVRVRGGPGQSWVMADRSTAWSVRQVQPARVDATAESDPVWPRKMCGTSSVSQYFSAAFQAAPPSSESGSATASPAATRAWKVGLSQLGVVRRRPGRGQQLQLVRTG